MSVTVIPYNDPTSEIFGAWRTIEEIKNKSKQIAMDQALAQQHIQSAQTIDQINHAKLQMEQQSAKEFTSPEGIDRRRQALNVGLQQDQQNLEKTQLENKQSMNINPLNILQKQQSVRLARISTDEAQANYNQMMDLMPSSTELKKMTIQAEKYKLISENLTDSHTADLLSQINAMKTHAVLTQLPDAIKLQQQQLQNALAMEPEKPALTKIQNFVSGVHALGGTSGAVEGAKAAFGGMSGYDFADKISSDSFKDPNQGGGPKAQAFSIAARLAGQGDQAGIDALSEMLASQMGAKAPSANDAFLEGLAQKSGMPVPADTIRPAAKKMAEAFVRMYKKDPKSAMDMVQGNPYIGDQSVEAQRNKVLNTTPTQGTIPIQTSPTNTLRGGEVVPSPTPVSTPQTRTQSGTQTIENQQPDVPVDFRQTLEKSQSAFDYAKKSIQDNPKVSSLQWGANSGKDQAADDIVLRPYDQEYGVSNEKTIYDLKDYQNEHQKRSGPNVAGPGFRMDLGSEVNSKLKDKDFQEFLANQALSDPQATVAQETRFRVALSQIARGYQEGGGKGLQEVMKLIGKNFPQTGPDGLTVTQVARLKSIEQQYANK